MFPASCHPGTTAHPRHWSPHQASPPSTPRPYHPFRTTTLPDAQAPAARRARHPTPCLASRARGKHLALSSPAARVAPPYRSPACMCVCVCVCARARALTHTHTHTCQHGTIDTDARTHRDRGQLRDCWHLPEPLVSHPPALPPRIHPVPLWCRANKTPAAPPS